MVEIVTLNFLFRMYFYSYSYEIGLKLNINFYLTGFGKKKKLIYNFFLNIKISQLGL